jgi:hypothetical protein
MPTLEAVKIRRYKKVTGRCYEIAYRFVMDNPEWLLIHGKLDLFDFLGKEYVKYYHAWARKGNEVFDPAHNCIYKKEEWKKFKPIEIKIYSIKEANLEVIKPKWGKCHYGPWENKAEHTT